MNFRTLALTALMLPITALAAGEARLYNPLGTTDIYAFFVRLLELIAQIAFPVIVLYLVYIGFKFVTAAAAGKPDKINEARNGLFYALVGALLVLGAYALAQAIQATVNEL